ncbi:MAG TPA: hypothetical protein VGR35_08785 [Tepidisphaeraceae bacterium]|nr:hypothetical protein [Tepidisphaeraceae bacterium]
MSLVVYVMPLWRYLAGDYESPRKEIAEPAAATRELVASPAEARAFVVRLRHGFRDVSRNALRWHDKGERVFAKPFDPAAWNALRAFAADQTYPVAGFNFGKESHRHPGLHEVRFAGGSPFVHTIRQHDTGGFYLPVDFFRPLELTVREEASSTILAGSSIALLRELNLLGPRMGMERDLGELERGELFAVRPEPLQYVKFGWAFLRHVARLSVQHRLPIILHGTID